MSNQQFINERIVGKYELDVLQVNNVEYLQAL